MLNVSKRNCGNAERDLLQVTRRMTQPCQVGRHGEDRPSATTCPRRSVGSRNSLQVFLAESDDRYRFATLATVVHKA